MKKINTHFVSIILILIMLLNSCVSLYDREMTRQETASSEVIGKVEVNFTSFQPFHIPIKKKLQKRAYDELLKAARREYGNDVDIRNIEITGGFSGWVAAHVTGSIVLATAATFIFSSIFSYKDYNGVEESLVFFGLPIGGLTLFSGNFQKITATGNVVNIAIGQTGIEGALVRAAKELSENFTASLNLAIVYIESEDRSQTNFIAGELEHILRRRGFVIIDRSELDRIRAEQQFGLSGEVDDSTAARIGQIAGASIVITGRVDGEGDLRRLRLRALDSTSGRVVGTASERL